MRLWRLARFICFEVAACALLLGALTMSVRLVGPTLWAVAATLALYGCFIVGTWDLGGSDNT